MSTPLTVSLLGAADNPTHLKGVWASLPLSLTEAASPTHLVAVDGQATDWAADVGAALNSGAVGVLVQAPKPGVDPADVVMLAAAADRQRVSLVAESAWATDPSVAALRDAVGADLPGMALVDVVTTLTVPDTSARRLPTAALDQFALLRALGLPLDSVRQSRWSAGGFTIIGTHGSSVVVLSAVISGDAAPHVRLDARGASGEVSLAVFDSADARPGEADVTNATGTLRLPSLYESASRAAWQRLHNAVVNGPAVNDLPGLAADLTLLSAADPTT